MKFLLALIALAAVTEADPAPGSAASAMCSAKGDDCRRRLDEACTSDHDGSDFNRADTCGGRRMELYRRMEEVEEGCILGESECDNGGDNCCRRRVEVISDINEFLVAMNAEKKEKLARRMEEAEEEAEEGWQSTGGRREEAEEGWQSTGGRREEAEEAGGDIKDDPCNTAGSC